MAAIPPIESLIERRADREPVFVKARCRTSSWHVADASLSDISAIGCCVATRTALAEGQPVEIRYGSNKGLPAIVRWARDLRAGVEFDTPLSNADLEELLDEHRRSTSNVSRLPLKAQHKG